MSIERTYADYLEDILNAIEKVAHFIEGMTYNQFVQDDRTAYAVVHAIEIIGEATKRVPPFVKDKHPGVPWREMAGMRDKLVHDYFGVNLALVWKTAIEDLPKLEPLIRSIWTEADKSPN
jgi:uncharacterized protein with HEPN domain